MSNSYSILRSSCSAYKLNNNEYIFSASIFSPPHRLVWTAFFIFNQSEVFLMKKNLRIGGYARVSTDEQKKYGYSIQAQIDEIKNWCSEHNHQLQNIYIDEGYSASNMKRPHKWKS